MSFDGQALWQIAVALIGGLAVGVERQWSGHASGPLARFAGLRTFTLLGLSAGLSGWLYSQGLAGLSIVLLAALGALVVAAYFAASRHDVEGTTEVAAVVVLTAGVLAGLGATRVASGIIAVTVLLLVEKTHLHGWVGRLDRVEVRAGARFAVMAMVVLPILPAGPFWPLDTVRPRLIWTLVLFFSGLSFVGFVARRVVGAERGYLIAGTLGGLISSTSVTLTFARLSRAHPESGVALAAGTMGANAVLFGRLAVSALVLAPALARAVWPAFVAPAIIAAAMALFGARQRPAAAPEDEQRNPLQLRAALQMAVLFQAVLILVALATRRFGDAGVYTSAAVLGLVDLDALTVSLAQLVNSGDAAGMVAKALVVGAASNTIIKLTIAVIVGRGRYRLMVGLGLTLVAAALIAPLVFAR